MLSEPPAAEPPEGSRPFRYGPAVALIAWFLLEFAALRALLRLPGGLGPVAVVIVWAAAGAALAALGRRLGVASSARRWLSRPLLPAGFLVVVLAVGLVAYPIVDERRFTGGGSDADDAVFLVIDGLRDGRDPYALDTYLGNPPTTGPGSAVWFFPWSTRNTYPIGIVLALGVTVVALRASARRWDEAALVAVLLAGSVPFWEGVAQGSDHLPLACSLVWAACALRPRAAPIDPRVAVLAGAAVGVLATSRAVFAFVPALAAAGTWWRDRGAALLFGATGTAIVVALHAAFIVRSGWDDYDAIQQLLVKSDEDLGAAGVLVVVGGVVLATMLVLRELRRRQAARVHVLLLAAVAPPMSAIGVAGLLTADDPSGWSAVNYFLDAIVLAAYWFAGSVLEASAPARAAATTSLTT
jgi:hypothetical protein